MRKAKTLKSSIDIFVKILTAFFVVFILYLVSKGINNFVYDYFFFPFISFIIVFICGINVGKGLERMKKNQQNKPYQYDNFKEETKTEFHVNERVKIITNKKILKELEDGNIVHVKTFNYNEIDMEEKDGDNE